MASGTIAEISSYVVCRSLVYRLARTYVFHRDEEYKRKVQQSIEPVVVIYFSSLDDRCKAMELMFEEINNDAQAVKFYRVNVDKHILLSRAYSDKILPEIVFVKNGVASLILLGSKTA